MVIPLTDLIALEAMCANYVCTAISKINVDLPNFEFATLKFCFTQSLTSDLKDVETECDVTIEAGDSRYRIHTLHTYHSIASLYVENT